MDVCYSGFNVCFSQTVIKFSGCFCEASCVTNKTVQGQCATTCTTLIQTHYFTSLSNWHFNQVCESFLNVGNTNGQSHYNNWCKS